MKQKEQMIEGHASTSIDNADEIIQAFEQQYPVLPPRDEYEKQFRAYMRKRPGMRYINDRIFMTVLVGAILGMFINTYRAEGLAALPGIISMSIIVIPTGIVIYFMFRALLSVYGVYTESDLDEIVERSRMWRFAHAHQIDFLGGKNVPRFESWTLSLERGDYYNVQDKAECVMQGIVGGKETYIFHYERNARVSKKELVTTKNDIIAVRLNAKLPQFYLNDKTACACPMKGSVLSLPPLVARRFTLIAPEGYSIEAYQIFTEDLLLMLAESPVRADYEFCGDMLIMTLEHIEDVDASLARLDAALDVAEAIALHFGKQIESIRTEKIGKLSVALPESSVPLKHTALGGLLRYVAVLIAASLVIPTLISFFMRP